jgi:hypothetical protein
VKDRTQLYQMLDQAMKDAIDPPQEQKAAAKQNKSKTNRSQN